MKIALNKRYGGFSLSEAACQLGKAISGDPYWAMGADHDGDAYDNAGRTMDRTDPVLVHVISLLGAQANGLSAKLVIENVPHGDKYRIVNNDGWERIEFPGDIHWQTADAEPQRLWDLKQFEEGQAVTKLVDEFVKQWSQNEQGVWLPQDDYIDEIRAAPKGWDSVETSHD